MNEPKPPSAFKLIRLRLGMTQQQIADALGTAQANVAGYDLGKNKPKVETAQKLIEVALSHGLLIDLNHLYGGVPLPPEPAKKAPAATAPPDAAPKPAARRPGRPVVYSGS